MTPQEKFNLIIDNNADFLLTKYQAYPNAKCYNGNEIHIDATRFYRNSETTYFYNQPYMYYIDGNGYSWQQYFNNYGSYKNDDQNGINECLEDVVVIGGHGRVIWYDEEYFRENGLSLVGYMVTNQRIYEQLLRNSSELQESTPEEININGNKYTIKELEDIIDLVEKLKNI